MRNKRDGHIFGRTDPIVPTEPWESECSYISVYGTIKCGVPPPPPSTYSPITGTKNSPKINQGRRWRLADKIICVPQVWLISGGTY